MAGQVLLVVALHGTGRELVLLLLLLLLLLRRGCWGGELGLLLVLHLLLLHRRCYGLGHPLDLLGLLLHGRGFL